MEMRYKTTIIYIVFFLQITLYEGANFKGRSMTFTEGHANMEDAGFYDCASSVIVEGGV